MKVNLLLQMRLGLAYMIELQLPTSVTIESAASMPCTLPTAAFPLYNPSGPIKLVAPWAEGGKDKYSGKSALVIGGSSSIGQYGSSTSSSRLPALAHRPTS